EGEPVRPREVHRHQAEVEARRRYRRQRFFGRAGGHGRVSQALKEICQVILEGWLWSNGQHRPVVHGRRSTSPLSRKADAKRPVDRSLDAKAQTFLRINGGAAPGPVSATGSSAT